MDKKKNKILIGCLALLLVMTVGYALFSENITINGTATAKGDFAYEIETMKGIDADIKKNNVYAVLNDYGVTGADMNFGNEDGVAESSISNTTNTITYSAALTNQGQSQYFTAKITNTGTIPMTFDIYYDFSQNSTITGNLLLDNGVLFDVNKVKNAIAGGEGHEYGFKISDHGHVMQLKGSLTDLKDIFVFKDSFDELEEDPYAIPKLDAGESIYLVFNSCWGNNINFSDFIVGLDVTGTNTITIPVKQITVQ